jgi:ribosomal protein S18 acetylase RimI-like enzyme
MDELEFINLADQEGDEWEQVESLFRKMYALMHELGLMLPLESGGALKWMSAARNTAEKFGKVVVAKDQGTVVAFAHGMIKFLPDYLGGQSVGIITHIFVDKDYRDRQVGARLVTMLEDWFRQKKVHSVELQVISGNPGAMEFWQNLGYREELRQFRKFVP